MSSRFNSNKVRVENTQDSPLFVTRTEVGTIVNIYNEVLSIAGLATSNIIQYTIPTNKLLEVLTIETSGTNRAVFSLDINGAIIAKQRSYFTEYNTSFNLNGLKLIEGDILKIIVENKSNSTADFNANILGRLEDA